MIVWFLLKTDSAVVFVQHLVFRSAKGNFSVAFENDGHRLKHQPFPIVPVWTCYDGFVAFVRVHAISVLSQVLAVDGA
jgi:hypothetical protein